MIGIPIGLIAANASEWLIHKYVLHGPGKKKDSFWAFSLARPPQAIATQRHA